LLGSDEDTAGALLDEANVGVVNGGAFRLAPYFRITYALQRWGGLLAGAWSTDLQWSRLLIATEN